MQRGRRFVTLGVAVAMTAGLMAGCGAEGGANADAPTTTGEATAATATTETDDSTDGAGEEAEEGLGSFDADDCFIDEEGHGPDCDPVEVDADDCFIDEEGHGPDCDQETVGTPIDGCSVDEDGHGPDCGEEGLGGPDELRYLSGWEADGTDLDVGTTFTLTCEPDGSPGEVWGTDPYSDESSLCTAAVHAGKITLEQGGTVGGERIDSRRTMPGGKANGITSQPADNWRGAIEFF